MTEYVLGFCFNSDKSKLVLIKKTHPDWQAGKLNGIGGKIEPTDETSKHAMGREFLEETGAGSDIYDWTQFCTLRGPNYKVYCFVCFDNTICDNAKTITDEDVMIEYWNEHGIWNTKSKQYEMVPYVNNLGWLIEMCLDDDFGKFYSNVEYY